MTIVQSLGISIEDYDAQCPKEDLRERGIQRAIYRKENVSLLVMAIVLHIGFTAVGVTVIKTGKCLRNRVMEHVPLVQPAQPAVESASTHIVENVDSDFVQSEFKPHAVGSAAFSYV